MYNDYCSHPKNLFMYESKFEKLDKEGKNRKINLILIKLFAYRLRL